MGIALLPRHDHLLVVALELAMRVPLVREFSASTRIYFPVLPPPSLDFSAGERRHSSWTAFESRLGESFPVPWHRKREDLGARPPAAQSGGRSLAVCFRRRHCSAESWLGARVQKPPIS